MQRKHVARRRVESQNVQLNGAVPETIHRLFGAKIFGLQDVLALAERPSGRRSTSPTHPRRWRHRKASDRWIAWSVSHPFAPTSGTSRGTAVHVVNGGVGGVASVEGDGPSLRRDPSIGIIIYIPTDTNFSTIFEEGSFNDPKRVCCVESLDAVLG